MPSTFEKPTHSAEFWVTDQQYILWYCELLVAFLDQNDQLAVDYIGKDLAPPVLGTWVLTTKHKYYFNVMILLKKNQTNHKTNKTPNQTKNSKTKPQANKPIFIPKSSTVTRCSTGEHQELVAIPECLLAFEKANHSETVMCLFPFSKANEMVWLSLLDTGKGHNCSDRAGF